MAQQAEPRQKLISPQIIQRVGLAVILLGLLVLASSLLVGVVRMAWQEHQINRAIERQRAQNTQQIERNRQLAGAADYAESDVAAERAARERLGMAREGEMVLLPTVILPAPPTAVPTLTPHATVAAPAARPMSNPARWFHALFPGRDVLP
jgi:cell division protein FtsB